MKNLHKFLLTMVMTLILMPNNASAQNEKRPLYVNENITTFVVSGENIKMIDLSCKPQEVVGNQPGNNICRIKPVKAFKDGEQVGVVTIVGERNISQFDLYYVENKKSATTEYRISQEEMKSYVNPAVDMTREDMYKYCWKILQTEKSFFDVSNTANKIKIRLNNLYSIGNYFFFDISCENKSNIRFDIEEIRTKLCDKKQSKATSTQEIEITPVMRMRENKSFKKWYRNVFVLEKLTFPDEKVLTFSFAEKPISGRTITLRIDYADVLNADVFDNTAKY